MMQDKYQTHRQAPVKVISRNINSLLNKIKRGSILSTCKLYRADVHLQETHLMGRISRCLNRYGFFVTLHAGFDRGSIGVAILLHKHPPFVITHSWHDPGGCYEMVTGTLYDILLGLCSTTPSPLRRLSISIPVGICIAEGTNWFDNTGW